MFQRVHISLNRFLGLWWKWTIHKTFVLKTFQNCEYLSYRVPIALTVPFVLSWPETLDSDYLFHSHWITWKGLTLRITTNNCLYGLNKLNKTFHWNLLVRKMNFVNPLPGKAYIFVFWQNKIVEKKIKFKRGGNPEHIER